MVGGEEGYVDTKYVLAWSRNDWFCSTRSTCENSGRRSPRDTRPIPAPQSGGNKTVRQIPIVSMECVRYVMNEGNLQQQ